MKRYAMIGGKKIPFAGVKETRSGWGFRNAWGLTMEMSSQEAAELFVDGADWHVLEGDKEVDCSEFRIAGPITDNRDGTVTVLMGAQTKEEKIAEQTVKIGDFDVLVAAMLALPPGQLKKLLSEDVLTVLRKYGYTE